MRRLSVLALGVVVARAPRRLLLLALGVIVLAGLGGCGGARSRKAVADARVGQVFFLCCNLRYDPQKPEITDTIAARGTLVPFATRVEVQKVTKDTVQFEAAGHPPITLAYEHGGKALSFDQYLSRLFVTEDPRLKLKKVPARQVKQVEKGTIAPGMSRDQVLLAVGYPPADRTPSLEAAAWTYGDGPDADAFVVYFDGNRVSSMQRGTAGRTRRTSN
jgi:hypothetical protein